MWVQRNYTASASAVNAKNWNCGIELYSVTSSCTVIDIIKYYTATPQHMCNAYHDITAQSLLGTNDPNISLNVNLTTV